MKINQVVIRNFKRFKEETFTLSDHLVIAGPNNSGKTTLLQAIATWSLALERWRELNNYQRRGGAYAKAPIARQAFYPVPLLKFDWLWHQRTYEGSIEIAITFSDGDVAVEIDSDSSEQVYVRPKANADRQLLQQAERFPRLVFVPAMTGLSIEEPVYQRPKINQLLGQGRPGEVLRNLLVETSYDQDAWERLTDSISNIFGYRLLPPNTDGPNIIAEYQPQDSDQRFDIASAGSGFLQVLMLLTFMNSQRKTALLLDEPDAHLHVILQDSIYTELRSAARNSDSQLIIATHSEVVINSVDPRGLCVLFDKPKRLADNAEKESLVRSLAVLSNVDVMLAASRPMIFYAEGRTDLDILRAWATTLNHPLMSFLKKPFFRSTVSETRVQAKGIKARDHFKSLLLVQTDMKGAQLMDRDGNDNRPDQKKALEGKLLKLCWKRYEIENYLIHPVSLARFVGQTVDSSAPLADVDAMKEEMRKRLPGIVVDHPMNDEDILVSTKMRKNILPGILGAAGLPNFDYTNYVKIAEIMQADEIHPEISEKLDAIAEHFNL